jgi:excisionase family DNA binding protein
MKEQEFPDNSDRTGRPMNLEQAAEYLSISRSCLYKLTSRGIIAYHKPSGKRLYFKKEDLDRYAFSNRSICRDEICQKSRETVMLGALTSHGNSRIAANKQQKCSREISVRPTEIES